MGKAQRPKTCTGKTRKGVRCKAAPLKPGTVIDGVTVKGKHCRAHDPDVPASARFGSHAQAKAAGDKGGRPPLPKPTELARQLVERHVTGILRPHFKALGMQLNDDGTVEMLERGAIVTGESKEGVVVASEIEDLGAQIAAAEKLLDRVYGRPKQTQELTGAGGGPVELVPVSRDRSADVVRLLAGTGAVRGGD
jgi:hypothetical protein